MVTYTVLDAAEPYKGLTRLQYAPDRSIVCVGTGPEIEAAIEAKLAQLRADMAKEGER